MLGALKKQGMLGCIYIYIYTRDVFFGFFVFLERRKWERWRLWEMLEERHVEISYCGIWAWASKRCSRGFGVHGVVVLG